MAVMEESKNNNGSYIRDLMQGVKTTAARIKDFIDNLPVMLEKLRDIGGTNKSLAIFHVEKGNYNDALFRFKIAQKFLPSDPDITKGVAFCFMQKGEFAKAIPHLKRYISEHGESEEVRFMLAECGEGVGVRIPLSRLRDYFDALAPNYDELFVNSLGYRGHLELVESIVKSAAITSLPVASIMDIGCGTGLVGELMTKYTNRLVGIDLSRGMLAIANEKRSGDKALYDSLLVGEFQEYLSGQDKTYSIITAACSINYMGDLSRLFAGVYKSLERDGVFAFSLEKLDSENEEYQPLSSRFMHSRSYVEAACRGAGLQIILLEDFLMMKDVTGIQCVAKKI